MTKVVNKYHENYDVYIGRGSKWGNPFVIGKDGDRGLISYTKKKNVHILKRIILYLIPLFHQHLC